jgi:F0F1-type ATP synthase epsilon subunit
VPVLARLQPTELRLHISEGEIKRYAQAEGWLQVFANHALVLVGEAIEPDQLDEASLRSRVSDAEARMAEAEKGTAAYARAEQDKLRAEAFLEVAGANG